MLTPALVLALVGAAPAGPPPPSGLYYESAFVAEVKARRYDPTEYRARPTYTLSFQGPGTFLRNVGFEDQACSWTLADGGAGALDVLCGGHHVGTWRWIGPGRAKPGTGLRHPLAVTARDLSRQPAT